MTDIAIKIEHLNYVYSPGTAYEKHALKDICLEIPHGEFVGIIGHTGSGKSTLIQHLNGLVKATDGALYYNGENIYQNGYDMRALRNQVGLVFQYPEYQLFEIDVLTDVCFGPKNQGLSKEECEKRALEALKLVGLKEKYYKSSPFELSGGQKRRVAIAGVLAMHPKVLVLDEPTAGLDPKGRDDILDQIAALHKMRGITIILVSHSMEDIAKYVERLIVMNHGEMVFDDTPKKVFAHYKELEKIGLAAPQMTYIMHALKEHGMDVDVTATPVEEARDTIRDITLGQYYPADSILHRLDPRVKFVGTIVYVVSLFLFHNWGYLLGTVFLAVMIKLSKVPFKFITKGLKSIFVLLAITMVFNILFTPGEVLVRVWKITITREGVAMACRMSVRLIFLMIGSSLMTLTTTPNQLTDALESLLGPLKKIHVPVHEISMMMSIALRFIPILLEETDKIMKAQMARGADFESGNIIQRVKNMVPLLVPLFISAFRRANDLALAMEARCYHGGEGRTQMKPLRYQTRDYAAYGVLMAYLVCSIGLRVCGL